jgi:hypothetical protein
MVRFYEIPSIILAPFDPFVITLHLRGKNGTQKKFFQKLSKCLGLKQKPYQVGYKCPKDPLPPESKEEKQGRCSSFVSV